MKRYFIISLLTLASTVAPLTAVFAQSSFIYEKGKSFKDVNASPMPQTIRLDRTAEPVIYENAVPENATTICYRIQLPSYVRGTFSVGIPAPEITNGPTIPIASYLGCSII